MRAFFIFTGADDPPSADVSMLTEASGFDSGILQSFKRFAAMRAFFYLKYFFHVILYIPL
jgi:hypothetical protein